MIQVIESGQRHLLNAGWLKTHWHFSFSDYYDPQNMNWGALRVFNEDWIKPESGFPLHPHDNMEIVTYVISGELTHKDSLGNLGVIRPGEIQRMTAGQGIVHAEFNASPSEEVHLLQMWVRPSQRGLEPGWEQKRFTREERRGRLLPVVSGRPGAEAGVLHMNQDATFFVSSLSVGETVTHTLGAGRYGYLFVIAGELEVNGKALGKGDQARIKDEEVLAIKAKADTELVLWDTN